MKLLKLFMSKFYSFIFSNFLLIVFLILWQILPNIGVLKKTYTSTPIGVLESIMALWESGQLKVHLFISLKRIMSGLLLAIIFAVPLGLFIGRIKFLESFLQSFLDLFRQISALALFPVFILFFGIGEVSKVAIIFWASLWPVLINTISGVKDVNPLYTKSVLTMGSNKFMTFTKVIFPASIPSIITGVKLASAYAVMVLVAAEMIGAQSGLGFLVNNSQETFNTPQMYAAIVLLSMLGIGLNFIWSVLENKLVFWRKFDS